MVVFKKALLLVALCCTSILSAQYIQVDDTYTAQQLVADVLIDNSPCAGVSNITVTGDPFSTGFQSYGYFTNTSPNFPFANGIVLSTARAFRSQGPNDNLIDEGSSSWAGDQDLNTLINDFTINATVLEFDFTPLTSHISFDYLFASEEYHDTATCTYSDAFAFLLKAANSSDPYQNLAVIPNTNVPVSVTNIHPAIPNGCPAMNENYFGSFNGNEHPINYNGQTVVMTAQANVIPGTTYHIKLVIADEFNYRYDSAIFLEGGSFTVGTDIGPDRLFATNNPVCAGDIYILDATEAGTNTYQWFKNGNLLAGETNATYPVTDAGIYSVAINLGGSGCIATGKATIEYAAWPVLNDPTALVQCDTNNDGITTFDLTSINTLITLGDPQFSSVVYYETLSDAQGQINAIQNPLAYQNLSTNQLTARVTNAYGCPAYATVNLQVSNNPMPPQSPIAICDAVGVQDGISTFDLASQVTPQVLTGLPAGLVAEYYVSANEAVLQSNPLPNNFTNTIPNQQIVYARIVNGPDCYGIIPVALVVNTIANFSNEPAFLCEGNPIALQVANTFSQYLWSNGDTDYTTTVGTPGIYTVTVTNANGCTATKTFDVSGSGIGTITNVDIHDFAGNHNSLLVQFTGAGHYDFSLDGIHFQDSPLFTNVPAGEYLVYIHDKNGCGTPPPTPIFVLDYPKYFTPNGDGFHDIWEIKNLNTHPDAVVAIFDRFGKLVYSFKGNGFGWNGKANATDLPSTDYWFTITLQNGRMVKSHFSLKR